jgi:tripartite-type tricarboxylate transporter receptor subunit TctC
VFFPSFLLDPAPLSPPPPPRPIVERLSKEVIAAAGVPEVRQTLLDMGIEARGSTPEETRKIMSAEIAKWRGVIERAGIERQ